MVGGIALLGVVTAAMASWFVEHVERKERTEADLRDQVAVLADELRALRAQLGRTCDGASAHGQGIEADPVP